MIRKRSPLTRNAAVVAGLLDRHPLAAAAFDMIMHNQMISKAIYLNEKNARSGALTAFGNYLISPSWPLVAHGVVNPELYVPV